MEITLGRARSAHDVGEAWTTADATELYEIARWGRDYFSIGDNGQVRVHPSKDPKRSIDRLCANPNQDKNPQLMTGQRTLYFLGHA